MRTPEDVAREAFCNRLEDEEGAWCEVHGHLWPCPEELPDWLTDLIRARDAEVAEAARKGAR